MQNNFKKGEKLYGVFVFGDPGELKQQFCDELGRDTRVQKVEYFAPSYSGVFFSRVIIRESIVDIANCMLFKREKDAREKEIKVQKEIALNLYDAVRSLKSDMEKVKKLLVLPR